MIHPALAASVGNYRLEQAQAASSGLTGNGITDIKSHDGEVIWFGTGMGLARTENDGASFQGFGQAQGLNRGSISALWVSHDTVWVASASDTLTPVSETSLPMGTGLSRSTDGGET